VGVGGFKDGGGVYVVDVQAQARPRLSGGGY
jgi:hypothetical protein